MKPRISEGKKHRGLASDRRICSTSRIERRHLTVPELDELRRLIDAETRRRHLPMVRFEVDQDDKVPLRLLPESQVELGLAGASVGGPEATRASGHSGRATGTGGTEPTAPAELPRAA